jgi:hypothetical protein
MKDPFNLFIDDSVDAVKNDYYKLMLKTKRTFFRYLNEGKSLEEFKKATEKIWENVDHSFMKQRIEELQDMIEARDLFGRKILNPDAEYDKVFDLVKEKEYTERELQYKKYVDKYYKGRLEQVKKDYIDTKSYLSDLVSKYDEMQQTIPYFNKDGTVRAWHNIASYNSMLYNTNLNRAGWNRTMYDANLLGNDLLYLPAHTFACPLCMPYQGKVYSKSGKYGTVDGVRYRPQQIAIDGGVGHPNCKHQWLIYWDSDMLQKNDYNSEDWEEKYKAKQKERAIKLEIRKLENDTKIFKNLGNQEEVEKTENKIRKLNSKLEEAQTSYK